MWGEDPFYGDPALRGPAVYASFLLRLEQAGVIEMVEEPMKERTDVFFVAKSGGRQRLIIDCRRSNCHFSRPRGVSLATGDSFSRLGLQEGQHVVADQVDYNGAFYRMGLPAPLRSRFRLRRVRRAAVRCGTQGPAFIAPRLEVLSAGWLRAL